MSWTKIGELAISVSFFALTFWAWSRLRHRRQSGDKAADFYVVDQADMSAAGADEYVTVAHFALQVDAEMARLRLEGEGVESVIIGPAMGGRSLLAGPAIELKVRAVDAAAATELLRQDSD